MPNTASITNTAITVKRGKTDTPESLRRARGAVVMTVFRSSVMTRITRSDYLRIIFIVLLYHKSQLASMTF